MHRGRPPHHSLNSDLLMMLWQSPFGTAVAVRRKMAPSESAPFLMEFSRGKTGCCEDVSATWVAWYHLQHIGLTMPALVLWNIYLLLTWVGNRDRSCKWKINTMPHSCRWKEPNSSQPKKHFISNVQSCVREHGVKRGRFWRDQQLQTYI